MLAKLLVYRVISSEKSATFPDHALGTRNAYPNARRRGLSGMFPARCAQPRAFRRCGDCQINFDQGIPHWPCSVELAWTATGVSRTDMQEVRRDCPVTRQLRKPDDRSNSHGTLPRPKYLAEFSQRSRERLSLRRKAEASLRSNDAADKGAHASLMRRSIEGNRL
jgi:hypothetical protein